MHQHISLRANLVRHVVAFVKGVTFAVVNALMKNLVTRGKGSWLRTMTL